MSLVKDEASGLDKVVLASEGGSTAEVFLHGAHVTSFKVGGEECLFVSKQAVYKPPKAIRGGIPVCFPQFSDLGPLGQHGFARNSPFTVESSSPAAVTLLLVHDGATHNFPHPFELRITVTCLDDQLHQHIAVKNTGGDAMKFTCALHTYYRVADVTAAEVKLLTGKDYLDSLDGRARKTEEAELVTFSGEVDRIYLQAGTHYKIVDPGNKRVYCIGTENFPDAVLWNPWIEKAASMGDFGDEEYKEMVCLEPAVASSGAVELAAAAEWSAKQEIRIRTMK